MPLWVNLIHKCWINSNKVYVILKPRLAITWSTNSSACDYKSRLLGEKGFIIVPTVLSNCGSNVVSAFDADTRNVSESFQKHFLVSTTMMHTWQNESIFEKHALISNVATTVCQGHNMVIPVHNHIFICMFTMCQMITNGWALKMALTCSNFSEVPWYFSQRHWPLMPKHAQWAPCSP